MHLLHDISPLVLGDTKPEVEAFGKRKLRRFRARPTAALAPHFKLFQINGLEAVSV